MTARVPVDHTALTARGKAIRERILAAAAALIHERGVAGTSIDDVRNSTGTSKSQLYHYFADKSALVAAVVERMVEQVLSAQQPELDGRTRWPGFTADATECSGSTSRPTAPVAAHWADWPTRWRAATRPHARD